MIKKESLFNTNIAIDLINSFLQVKLDRRMSASKALNHLWFNEVV